MHIGLQVLRAKIRGFNAAGLSIHDRIHKAKGLRRNSLWNEKRQLGDRNRSHLIAYGLIRGIAYERIERCAKENMPDAKEVFDLMIAHGDRKLVSQLTLESVKALLVCRLTTGSIGSSLEKRPAS